MTFGTDSKQLILNDDDDDDSLSSISAMKEEYPKEVKKNEFVDTDSDARTVTFAKVSSISAKFEECPNDINTNEPSRDARATSSTKSSFSKQSINRINGFEGEHHFAPSVERISRKSIVENYAIQSYNLNDISQGKDEVPILPSFSDNSYKNAHETHTINRKSSLESHHMRGISQRSLFTQELHRSMKEKTTEEKLDLILSMLTHVNDENAQLKNANIQFRDENIQLRDENIQIKNDVRGLRNENIQITNYVRGLRDEIHTIKPFHSGHRKS